MKKSSKTKSKTQTVTNAQMLTATFALLLANGFALVTLPAKTPVVNCPVQLKSSYFCQFKKGVPGYRQFIYTCPNGKSFQVSGSCRTADSVRQLALKVCKEKKYCALSKSSLKESKISPQKEIQKLSEQQKGGVISQSIKNYVDVGFIGRPEESVSFSFDKENRGILTIQYINRGPADVLVSTNESQRARVLITLLDQSQQPLRFEPESFMPVLESGKSVKTSFQISPETQEKIISGEAKFFKVELIVGKREVGDQGVFDADITNNMIIIPILTTSFSVTENSVK